MYWDTERLCYRKAKRSSAHFCSWARDGLSDKSSTVISFPLSLVNLPYLHTSEWSTKSEFSQRMTHRMNLAQWGANRWIIGYVWHNFSSNKLTQSPLNSWTTSNRTFSTIRGQNSCFFLPADIFVNLSICSSRKLRRCRQFGLMAGNKICAPHPLPCNRPRSNGALSTSPPKKLVIPQLRCPQKIRLAHSWTNFQRGFVIVLPM